ncbi:hypothetical protein LJC61_02415 [Ruminococcaceae bacterium OttesenSCG-928-A16]|nr:hypothetical protein [Ruminococcaceae bacterium OttesenSCG-928-A16]
MIEWFLLHAKPRQMLGGQVQKSSVALPAKNTIQLSVQRHSLLFCHLPKQQPNQHPAGTVHAGHGLARYFICINDSDLLYKTTVKLLRF